MDFFRSRWKGNREPRCQNSALIVWRKNDHKNDAPDAPFLMKNAVFPVHTGHVAVRRAELTGRITGTLYSCLRLIIMNTERREIMNFRNQPANRARRRQRRKNNPFRPVIAVMLALTGLCIVATGNIAAGLLLILFALSITRRVQYFMTARHLGKAFRAMIPAALFVACCLVLPPVGAREEPAP